MFMIAIPQDDIPLLTAEGCNVTINGEQAVLRRNGDYLCYGDKRCKILDEHVSGKLVQFTAASHGDEDEPHLIIRPDIEAETEHLLAFAKAQNKLVDAAQEFHQLSERLDGKARHSVSCIASAINNLILTIYEQMGKE